MVPSEKLLNTPAKGTLARHQNVTTVVPKTPLASKFARAGHPILALQRSIGNRRVAELLRMSRISTRGSILPVQAKLTVGAANDPQEKEAEDVSRQVVGMADEAVRASSKHASSREDKDEQNIHRTAVAHAGNALAPSPREEDKDDRQNGNKKVNHLRRQATILPSLESFEAGPAVEARIVASDGRGSPLPDNVRAYMEPRFGNDFGHVKVHKGSDAAALNDAIGARAFTHGTDIYFGRNHGPNDAELTAHELTHVVQQTGSRPIQPCRTTVSLPLDSAIERSTEKVGAMDANGLVQRQPGPASASSATAPAKTPPPTSAATFDPDVTRDLDLVFVHPTDDIVLAVNVANARSAPAGTSFAWRWSQMDQSKVAPRGAVPPNAPSAKLSAEAKSVSESSITPEVEVTSAKSAPAVKQAKPVSISVEKPSAVWSDPLIVYGNLAHDKPRKDDQMYVGDTYYLEVEFKDMQKPKEAGLVPKLISTGIAGKTGDFTGKSRWVSDKKFAWEITASQAAGKRSFSAAFWVPGTDDPISKDFELSAISTAEYFKGRCSTAESTLNSLHAAGREWFLTCFQNYKKGYEEHSAAIRKQANAEQLARDMLLAVLFGGIGGLAGGALGGALEASKKTMQAEFGNIAQGAMTDAAKDITKAVARIPANLMRGGGGGGGAPGGAPPTPTVNPQGATGQGELAAAAIDPLDWMTAIDKGIYNERTQVGAQVVLAHQQADQCLANNPECSFDWDPVEVITEGAKIAGNPIDNLGEIPRAIDYERAFWIAWLSQYAYVARYMPSDVPFGAFEYVAEAVGSKIAEHMEKLASQFGETADQWIEKFGAPARRAAEAEKKKYDDASLF